jgi:hypothetical protein
METEISVSPPPENPVAATVLPSVPDSAVPSFPRCPGETPRAFGAFTAFFQLGHSRSLQAVADRLGEKPDTVKGWSSKYRWSERIHDFNSGLLRQQAEAQVAARRHQAAEWERRAAESRELQFMASRKLLDGALCYLENLGDQEVAKMSLGQASRALQVASRLASLALTNGMAPEAPALVTLPAELTLAVNKVYPRPPAPPADSAAPVPPATDEP